VRESAEWRERERERESVCRCVSVRVREGPGLGFQLQSLTKPQLGFHVFEKKARNICKVH